MGHEIPPSEKAKIIELFEQSHLPARRTFDKIGSRAIGGILRSRLAALEAYQAVLSIGRPPAIEAHSTDAKTPTGLADITNLVSVLEHPQLVIHIASEFVNPDHPSHPRGLG